MIKVASGIFTWDAVERRSNRYGSFVLTDTNFNKDASASVTYDLAALRSLEHKRVHVVCKVITARKSGHLGDGFLKIVPSQPEVGEEIDLGVGVLHMEPGFTDSEHTLKLHPGDAREVFWMDPRKLYRLHDQTVEVFVEETAADFSPIPDIQASTASEEAMVVADGVIQVKTVEDGAFYITPKIENMGDGMFIVTPLGAPGTKGEKFPLERRRGR